MINIQTFGDGRPLVLFHGWGFDSQIWWPLLKTSVEPSEFKFYLVDLPGFGLTPNMQWQDFKTDLLSLLPDRFMLLGWSLGGLFATRLCIEEPSRIEKLINVTSSPYFINAEDWIGIDKSVFAEFYEQFKAAPQKTRTEFIHSQLNTDYNFELQLSDQIDLYGLEKGLDFLLHWDLRGDLHQLELPVLFMFGKLDSIVPRKLMPLLQGKFPQFKYVMIRRAAHVPFLSHMQEFNEILREFCK